MDLSTRILVVLALTVMLVAVLASFIFFNSGAQITKADAEKLFNERCLSYAQRGCSWEITYDPEFVKYLDACKTLYGADREALSCMYSLCQQCKNFQLADIRCESMCRGITGQKNLGNNVEEACTRYKEDLQCTSIKCSACNA